MAKMIPPHWHDKTPRSEQRVFSLLQNDPQTEDWVVLHSLNLKQSGTRPYGEVDFVVLIPGAGVFCLEVKGGRVACKDGAWTTTDASGATFALKRSPFSPGSGGNARSSKIPGRTTCACSGILQSPVRICRGLYRC